MTILLDECLPHRLARLLAGHEVKTSRQMNWQGLSNGRLLAAADPHFDVFLTVDKILVQQQRIEGLRLARGLLDQYEALWHGRIERMTDLITSNEETDK